MASSAVGEITYATPRPGHTRKIPEYMCPVCGFRTCVWHKRRHEKGARHKARARRHVLRAQGWVRMGPGNHQMYKSLRVPMKLGPSSVSEYGINYAYWVPAWAMMLMNMIMSCIGPWDREDSRRILRRIANKVFREVRDEMISKNTEDFWNHCHTVSFVSMMREKVLLSAAKARSCYYACPKCNRLVHYAHMARHYREGEHERWLESVTNVA